ncbi:MAG: glycosyltransferase family 39 protein [Polyangiaceae bacterium]|nr:glycosyltransferase family 39 protein [Polyangiaceae bacterium]
MDGLALAGLGLALRLAVVGWAWGRFPPVADGAYYHLVAQRIAAGQGYTWLWPDGVVTYAAHYPVGYPAMIGGLYALFGGVPEVAMIANAVLGAVGVLGAHRIGASVSGRHGALVSGGVVAVHPGLIAYTPALMTEGVVASLLAVAGALAVLAREAKEQRSLALRVTLGGLLGFTTLVRPQTILLAPLFGLVAARSEAGWRGRLSSGLLALVLAMLTVAPWTLRNCFMMSASSPGRFHPEACAFVSANAGWNLLIGAAPGATGQWVPIERVGVPFECRHVFGEVEKDRCFGRAGIRDVLADPLRWLALVPAKLSGTFDGGGAASYYLHTANQAAFGNRVARGLDLAEALWQRLLLLAALLAIWREGVGWRGRLVEPASWPLAAVLGAAGAAALGRPGWLAYLGLVFGTVLLGRRLQVHPPAALAVAVVGTTALAHAVFFGAGRYSMVTFCVLGALAGAAFVPARAMSSPRPDPRVSPGG